MSKNDEDLDLNDMMSIGCLCIITFLGIAGFLFTFCMFAWLLGGC